MKLPNFIINVHQPPVPNIKNLLTGGLQNITVYTCSHDTWKLKVGTQFIGSGSIEAFRSALTPCMQFLIEQQTWALISRFGYGTSIR